MSRMMSVFLLFLLGSVNAQANEYPSEETVMFALNCMAELGGQTDENLYACLCRYDGIRAAMTYSDYEEAVTYARNKAMPGEKGGFFRSSERGKNFYKILEQVRKDAIAQCPVAIRVQFDRSKYKKSAGHR